MLDKAIQKLKSEKEQNSGNGYIQFVGQALIDYLKDIPSAAEAILTEGKTIAKSLDAMAAEAKKKPRTGNMVMLTLDEGIKIVLQYFGIIAPEHMTVKVNIESNCKPYTVMPSQKNNDFDISLEDLL